MPLSAADAVTPAIKHAKKQLFRPFRFGQWSRLALVGFLAGELGSGGSCNGPRSFRSNVEAAIHRMIAFWHTHAALIAAMITGAIVFLFLLGILFTYLNSRMRFILFDSVIHGECRIREYWARRGEAAWRFFVWQLIFGLCSLAVFAVFIGLPVAAAWAAGWFRHPREHLPPLIFGGILIFFLFLVLSICSGIIRVLAKDFVVPYMAVEDLTVLGGWGRLWSAMKAEMGSYAGYIGMKIVLAIAAGIIFGILGLIALVIFAIPVVLVAVVVGVVAAAAGLAWNVFTVTLTVVASLGGFFLVIYLFAFISVPAIVFFPAYSIHFLASRYAALEALLHPAPPPAPEMPPPMPPLPA